MLGEQERAPAVERAEASRWCRLALTGYLLSWLVVVVLSAHRWFGVGPHPPRYVSTLSIDAAWIVTLILAVCRGAFPTRRLALRAPRSPWSVAWAVGVLVVYDVFAAVWGEELHIGSYTDLFSDASQAAPAAAVLLGIAAVVSPITEELFFRGFLFGAFSARFPAGIVALVVGVLFALVHTVYPLAVLPDLVFLGAVLCLAREQTGSILPGMAVVLYLDVGRYEHALTGSSAIAAGAFVLTLGALAVWART